MKRHAKLSLLLLVAVITGLLTSSVIVGDRTLAQAGRKTGDKQKKNPGATGEAQEEQQQEEKKVDKLTPPSTLKISTDIVNVDAVVYNKKTGQVIQNLKKENFEIYEDGIKQDVENFATPDAPLTLVMLARVQQVGGCPGLCEYRLF